MITTDKVCPVFTITEEGKYFLNRYATQQEIYPLNLSGNHMPGSRRQIGMNFYIQRSKS